MLEFSQTSMASGGEYFSVSLRDTQNYVYAAGEGMSIFDLPAYRAERDLEQWQPIIEWANAD
jgi:hypothetical protein